MAKGKPKKWATAYITEPLILGNAGITVVVWDKWGKTRRGTAIVSVGGIRWLPYKAQRPYRVSWEALQQWLEGS